jgi:hypothetical protein
MCIDYTALSWLILNWPYKLRLDYGSDRMNRSGARRRKGINNIIRRKRK